jgi:hypothetical protein
VTEVRAAGASRTYPARRPEPSIPSVAGHGSGAELARTTLAVVEVPYTAWRRPLLARRPLPAELGALVADTVGHRSAHVAR